MKEDQKGVSPVIATILMVVVTVTVAAVLGIYVYGQSEKLGAKPSASLVAKDKPNVDDELVIKHSGGDALDWADLRISCTEGADSATIYKDPSVSSPAILSSSPVTGDTPNQFVAAESVVVVEESDGTPISEDKTYHVAVMHEPTGTVLLDSNVTSTSD